MKKKILAIALAVVILATAAVAATLAWFTDTEADETTTVTVGNVKIDLAAVAEENLLIVPGELPSTNIYAYNTTVTNTGLNDAWVRVKVLVPVDINSAIRLVNGESAATADGDATLVEVDEVSYMQYTFTKATKLTAAAGADHSFTPVTGYYLDPTVDCDDEGAYYLNGVLLPDLQSEVGNIIVKAEAIQETGFVNAAAAFAKFDAQVTGTAEVDGTTPAPVEPS